MSAFATDLPIQSFELDAVTRPDTRGITEAEWQVRTDLAACYRACGLNGWDDLIYTHISARVPGPDHHFLVNPSGLSFDEVTAANLVKIDLEGNFIGQTYHKANAAGFVIHGGIHMAREDAGCIIHLHTEAGMALSMLEEGLLPLNQHAMRFHNRIGYHDYEGIALSTEERIRMIANLGTHDTLILRSHGTLTLGATVAEAFVQTFYLEKAARAQMLALATGRALIRPTEDVMEKTAQQWAAGRRKSAPLEWASVLRKLDRVDPSYRDRVAHPPQSREGHAVTAH